MVKLALICAGFYAAGFGSAVAVFLLLRERLVHDRFEAQLRSVYGQTLKRAHEHSLNTPSAISLQEIDRFPRHRENGR